MRKPFVLVSVLAFATVAFAGFKVKLVKPKKAEQFQTRATAGAVTLAADLLLEGKDQKDYFYKELTPSNLVAVRLAVFNGGREEVILPLDGLQLVGPDGSEVALVPPDTVAQAVLGGMVVNAAVKERQNKPVSGTAGGTVGAGDPRYDPRVDPRDPRYDPNDPRVARNPSDPRYDPNDPRYDPNDPRIGRNPRDPRYDPTYDPNDPRARNPSDPRYDPRYGRGYPGYGPSIILNPGGGTGGADLSQFERGLAAKDFSDKAHSRDPISPSLNRDRFLFFSLEKPPASPHGFVLRIPAAKGIPQEVVLKF